MIRRGDYDPGPMGGAFGGNSRFALVRQIGAGGMGVVYEALDRERQSRVALKTLQRLTAEGRLRFKREFRALADLQHDNLVTLDELFEEEGRLFYTMEYVDGVDFVRFVRPAAAPDPNPSTGPEEVVFGPHGIASDQTLHEPRLRSALAQLASGLCALHRANKVHRDIKPSNILVTREGRVVLLDFGLIADADKTLLSAANRILGTVLYMAPEQTFGAKVGTPADWYSVGVLLYQALTGAPPFVGARGFVIRAKRARLPDPPRQLVSSVPEDLNRLCVDLLQIDPAYRPTGEEVLRRLAGRQPGAEVPAIPRWEFVGRAAELAELEHVFAQVRGGESITLLVHGESGVGKSALVNHFLDRVTASRQDSAEAPLPLVLRGHCYERESVPYKAVDEVIDALSAHLSSLSQECKEELLPPNYVLASHVFPTLAPLGESAAPRPAGAVLRPDVHRSLAFAALRELFARLAKSRPLIVSIDDLHWTDGDSLRLLAEILRPPRPPPLLLLATVRSMSEAPGGIYSAAELAQQLGSSVRHLRVQNLPPAEARALACRLVADFASSAERGGSVDIAAVIAESAGHPLFIEALVHHRLAHAHDRGGLLLDDALRWQVSRLDADSRNLLELLCVAGGPLVRRIAAFAKSANAIQLAKQIGVLKSANLIKTTGSRTTDLVATFHDRVREATMATLDEQRRSRLHHKLAVALEMAGDADPEMLAEQWRAAGEPTRAADYAARAAAAAFAALAFDRAARLYRLCLTLRPTNDPAAPALRVSLGDALVHGGRGAEAASQYLAAAAELAADQALELRRRAAEQLVQSGHLDQGLVALGEALEAVGMSYPQSPRRALVRLLWRQFLLALGRRRFRERPVAAIAPPRLRRIDTCWSAAHSLALVDPVRGRLFQSYHLAYALRAGEPYRIARALAVDATYESNAGTRQRARTDRLLAAMWALAKRIDHPHALAWGYAAEGTIAYLYGDWRRAWDYLRRGEEAMGRWTGVTTWEVDTLQLFGFSTLAQLGDFHELAQLLPERMRVADERNDLFAAFNLRSGHINVVWLAQDDPELARERAREAARHLSQRSFYVQHYYDLLAQGQIDLYLGEGMTAHQRVMRLWPPFASSLLPRVQHTRSFAHYLRGRTTVAAAWSRRAPEREARCKEADRIAKRLAGEGTRYTAPFALVIRAGSAAARGQNDQALSLLEQAAPQFEGADMVVHAAAARRQRGLLCGGDEGRAAIVAADDILRGCGVVDPERFAAMLVPRCGY